MLDLLDQDVTLPLWLCLLLPVAIGVLILTVWSLKHRQDPRFRSVRCSSFSDACRSIAGLTHGDLIAGNSIVLLENGDYFSSLLADIGAARRSIHFETYLWKEGQIGREIASALADRARDGIQVRVLVDAHGGKNMGKDTERLLDASKVSFAWCHPYRFSTFGHINRRDHRKLAVIDGHSAYVGGHCVVDDWTGDAQDRQHFRDVSVKVAGPIVRSLQSTFSENWIATTGELFLGEAFFPELERVGDSTMHVARIQSAQAASDVKMLHHLVIESAARRILIQNHYFLPDEKGIELLIRAIDRGVDIQVMVPSANASDMPIVQHAAHHSFPKLLDAGIRIFEYQKTLLHQKIIVVDGCWAAIGSTNFDGRSFEINDEISLGVYDRSFAKQLEDLFARDAAECLELHAESLTSRSFTRRVMDRALYSVSAQL